MGAGKDRSFIGGEGEKGVDEGAGGVLAEGKRGEVRPQRVDARDDNVHKKQRHRGGTVLDRPAAALDVRVSQHTRVGRKRPKVAGEAAHLLRALLGLCRGVAIRGDDILYGVANEHNLGAILHSNLGERLGVVLHILAAHESLHRRGDSASLRDRVLEVEDRRCVINFNDMHRLAVLNLNLHLV